MKTTLFTVALLTAGLHALNLGSQAATALSTTTLSLIKDDTTVVQALETVEKKEEKIPEVVNAEAVLSVEAGSNATNGGAKTEKPEGIIQAIGPMGMRPPGMFGNANMGMMGPGSNPYMN